MSISKRHKQFSCQYILMVLQWLENCKSRQNLLMTNHCVVLSAYTTLNRLWILYVNQERPINLCWCRRYFVQFDVIYWSALIYCRPLPPVLCCENGLRKKKINRQQKCMRVFSSFYFFSNTYYSLTTQKQEFYFVF